MARACTTASSSSTRDHRPWALTRLALAAAAAMLMTACGSDTQDTASDATAPVPAGEAESPRPPPGSMPEGVERAGQLTVTIAEVTFSTEGRIRRSGFTPSTQGIDLTLKGQVAGTTPTATEDQDLWFVILVDSVEPGTYPLVWSTNQIADKDGTQAWIKVGASDGIGLSELLPKEGSLTLDRVELATEGKARVVALAGSFDGSFFDDDDEVVAASGSFTFRE